MTEALGTSESGVPRLPKRVKGDLRFLSIYVFTLPTAMRYKHDPEHAKLTSAPRELLGRLEGQLAGEADRYRLTFASILAVVLMPALMAGFLWSAMYWLPVRIYWWPFDRGNYGLPFFSLYEWLCFICLAAFFAYTWALLRTSREETRRMSVDLARLVEATASERVSIAHEAASGQYPRAQFVLRKGKPFAEYRSLLDAPASEIR